MMKIVNDSNGLFKAIKEDLKSTVPVKFHLRE